MAGAGVLLRWSAAGNMAGKTLRQHSLNRLWLMALTAQPELQL